MIASRAMTQKYRGFAGAGVIMVCLFATCACEEEKAPEPDQASESPAVIEPLPVAPKPEPEPEPERPQKKFEDCAPGTQVQIDNPDLEAAIRMKAQKPEGELTTVDLKKLRSLNLARVQIEELDICLFHHMTELRELFIGPVGIDDLSPLSGLKNLETIGFAMNPITDLSPLAEMTKMDRLDMANTKVTDLSPLSKMTAMTELTLDGSPVEDTTALHGMTKLERLSIKGTKIDDIRFLSEMKDLKFLYINDSPIARDVGQTGVVVKNGAKVISD